MICTGETYKNVVKMTFRPSPKAPCWKTRPDFSTPAWTATPPGTGRYLLTDVIASGPAMFETTRLDHVGGVRGTDPDPIAELRRRAAAAGLKTASLDEVLCITAV